MLDSVTKGDHEVTAELNFAELIFVAHEAKNAGNAIVLARLSNEVRYKKQPAKTTWWPSPV